MIDPVYEPPAGKSQTPRLLVAPAAAAAMMLKIRTSPAIVRARCVVGLATFSSPIAVRLGYGMAGIKAPAASSISRYAPEFDQALVAMTDQVIEDNLSFLADLTDAWTLSMDGVWTARADLQAHGCVVSFAAHISGGDPFIFMIECVQRPAASSRVATDEHQEELSAKSLEPWAVRHGIQRLQDSNCAPAFVVVDGDGGVKSVIAELLPTSQLANDRNHLLRHVGRELGAMSDNSVADLWRSANASPLDVRQAHESVHSKAVDQYNILQRTNQLTASDQLVPLEMLVDSGWTERADLHGFSYPLQATLSSQRHSGKQLCSKCKEYGHDVRSCATLNDSALKNPTRVQAVREYKTRQRDGVPSVWADKFKGSLMRAAELSKGSRATARFIAHSHWKHYSGEHVHCAQLAGLPLTSDLPDTCKCVSQSPIQPATAVELMALADQFFGPDAPPALAAGLMLNASTNINESFNCASFTVLAKGRTGLRRWAVPFRMKFLDLAVGRVVWRANLLKGLQIALPDTLRDVLEQQQADADRKAALYMSDEGRRARSAAKRARKTAAIELRIKSPGKGYKTGTGIDLPALRPSRAGSKRRRAT